MNIQFETRCKTCHQPQEYLNHGKSVKNIIRDGDTIGQPSGHQKIVLVHFYCNNCKINQSIGFPYQNPDFIPLFIEDIKKNTPKFDNREYIEI